jgi:hypothetical protein
MERKMHKHLRSLGLAALMAACADPATSHTGEAVQKLIANRVLQMHLEESASAITFTDTSPQQHHGACTGATCPTRNRIGLVGHASTLRRLAAEFDGVDDCITIADNSDHSLSLPFTISAWILPRALPASNTSMTIASKYSTLGNQREWTMSLGDDNGTAKLGFAKSSLGTSGSTTAVYASRSFSPTDRNRWMHVVLRANASGAFEWWINGALDSTGIFPSNTFFAGSATTRIGCVEKATAAPDSFFSGKLDELLIAKSYISNADLQQLYTRSRPTSPKMTFLEGHTLLPNKQIDVPELDARIRDLGMDEYEFVIHRKMSSCSPNGSCEDHLALRDLLGRMVASPGRAKVVAGRNPLWFSTTPTGADATCLAKPNAEEKWGCAIGDDANDFPGTLTGWTIDDFFVEHNDEDHIAFFDRTRFERACTALRERNPSVKVYATMYCPTDISKYRCGYDVHYNLDWWPNTEGAPVPDSSGVCSPGPGTIDPLRETDLIYEYVTETGTDGVDTTLLQSCLSGVNVYGLEGTPASVINECVDGLRPMQQLIPGFEIRLGVYTTTGLRHPTIDCVDSGPPVGYPNEQDVLRQDIIESARLTAPDAFVFYVMPQSSDTCSPSSAYGYQGFKDFTANPQRFIRW